jgi:hypothetical protein
MAIAKQKTEQERQQELAEMAAFEKYMVTLYPTLAAAPAT